jgi:uncharacterized membrane protein
MTGFLEESPGVKSSTRLIVGSAVGTALLVFIGMAVTGLYTFITTRPHLPMSDLQSLAGSLATLFGATVIAAAVMHVGGKIAENGSNQSQGNGGAG